MNDHDHLHEENGAQPTEGAEPPKEAMTAFVVIVYPNGKAVADGNPELFRGIDVTFPAQLDTMWRACKEVAKDIEYMKNSEYTVNAYMTVSQQMKEQEQQARLMGKLHEKGLRIPGQ